MVKVAMLFTVDPLLCHCGRLIKRSLGRAPWRMDQVGRSFAQAYRSAARLLAMTRTRPGKDNPYLVRSWPRLGLFRLPPG